MHMEIISNLCNRCHISCRQGLFLQCTTKGWTILHKLPLVLFRRFAVSVNLSCTQKKSVYFFAEGLKTVRRMQCLPAALKVVISAYKCIGPGTEHWILDSLLFCGRVRIEKRHNLRKGTRKGFCLKPQKSHRPWDDQCESQKKVSRQNGWVCHGKQQHNRHSGAWARRWARMRHGCTTFASSPRALPRESHLADRVSLSKKTAFPKVPPCRLLIAFWLSESVVQYVCLVWSVSVCWFSTVPNRSLAAKITISM